MADKLTFASEEAGRTNKRKSACWRILIVDDEDDVHRVTRLVLNNITFLGRGIELVSVYTASDAIDLLSRDQDFAIILLDVVMETDDAGFKVIKHIRETLHNIIMRIILRTGQPGQAPEQKVILQYDINDYKAKTELTSEKLFTAIISSLRAYNDLVIIERSKKGLEKIVRASANIFELQSMKKFVQGALMQLVSMLRLDDNAVYCQASGFSATTQNGELKIIAAVGNFNENEVVDHDIEEILPKESVQLVRKAMHEKHTITDLNRYIVFFESKVGSENLIYLERDEAIDDWERDLIDIFCTNIAIAFDNIHLNQELETSQKEIIFTLGEFVETRSNDTHNHVRRVGEISKYLAKTIGMPEEEAEILRLASAMHDIGKLAIPDSVLLKEGQLDEHEYEVMKRHASAGGEMLKSSKRNILKPAGIIAYQHHERYDGTGYPGKLKGEEIHIYARITAVADVYDALMSDRCYRHAYAPDEVLSYFRENSGKHFDPQLTEILLANIEEIEKIRKNVNLLDE